MSESLKFSSFRVGNQDVSTHFIETQAVKEGVSCDVYAFEGDSSRDLGIITIRKGCATPRQRVLQGDVTLEGYLSGGGSLTVGDAAGKIRTYSFPAADSNEVAVAVGETMQWQAADEADLVVYEICEPPYADGRFENLAE